jgi:hypothetical protein
MPNRWRRGGRLPQASGSPAPRRATRDLLRRRLPLAHQRAALLAPGHHTHSPSHRPAIGTQLASKAHREGVAARCAAPAVHTRLAVELARITSDDARRRDVARPIVTTATHPDAHTLYGWHTVPGIGTRLRRVLRDDIPQIDRFSRGQDVVSSCRLVTGARASAGTREGTSGTPLGQAHLPGAFAAAAVLCRSDPPAAPQDLARLEQKPDQGQARTILAHT